MSSDSYFNGKVAVVTGSSSGIGRQTAKMLAGRGAKIVIIGRPDAKDPMDSVEDAKNEMLSAGSNEQDIHTIVAELCDPTEPKRIVDETIKKFSKIDILINCAGFVSTDPDAIGVQCHIEHFGRMIDIHCNAVILMVQAATPHLIQSKGVIVNVSSIVAMPFVNQVHAYYGAAKAAQDYLTVQMAGHLIKDGIRVNSVQPGLVSTNIAAGSGVKSAVGELASKFLETPGCIPAGKLASTADIAKVIIFLADSSQSEYINGVRLPVDGGAHLFNIQLFMDRK